jgi:hypothetical protein
VARVFLIRPPQLIAVTVGSNPTVGSIEDQYRALSVHNPALKRLFSHCVCEQDFGIRR